ncbi:MAG: hypothetical protein HOQ32_07915 [Lysobacter sp.]|nr:hypothetical protein [Lysobacter sp.]
MPEHLRAGCSLYIVSLAAQAVLAPLHDTGIWRFVTPFICLLLIAVTVLFMLRAQWAWGYMIWVAVYGVTFNLIFFPAEESYGQYFRVSQVLAVVEMLACAAIIWSMRRNQLSQDWFRKANED